MRAMAVASAAFSSSDCVAARRIASPSVSEIPPALEIAR
jgi:hypothetical protein